MGEKTYRLVLVRWWDSSCETVGWLIHECEDCITVVPTRALNQPDHGIQGLRIPAAVVQAIVGLEREV